jgi:hypothetical protein
MVRMEAAKLTLKLEKGAISNAKKYAKMNKTSLSRLVEGYFRNLSQKLEPPQKGIPISPRVRKLSGILKNQKIDYKAELESILLERHNLK